ncbi:M14 family zinc carboxypeptidase [Marinirhabdus gelatinilytica]|uniref:Zinc carboxypeptidase n=1 Tax=Marinirhabdus gelatinilytica TaxID=1703343 RepID=A0A370QEX2_9FLAO|nr:M14 family zinc carboxypeptidase [Marinirhabdus gelatinilytica]RDK86924.1 zinc carboxypeptidase [Marinirhabdus gelatinilytica]
MKKLLQLFLFTLTLTTVAQDYTVDLDYYLPEDVTYNPAVPTPKSAIGHEVGDWHITHDKLSYYMKALADASDRITLEDRGTTFEGRPLQLLIITSPANHNNIDNIRQNHVALTESGSNSLNTSTMPIVVYQGFSIHGNEPSGSNAALAVAYYLAAAQGPKIDELLDHTVILFDPSLNPDGLQRFSYWANMHKSQNINPDPYDREYDEVWPGGRTNHYWFDMNRDWLPVQLPESRARIETFHEWYPNILTDHHEMGTNSSFFFQPGIPSRTHPLTPKLNQELTGKIGNYHAKALDKIGSFYYTEENFDDFYYGKGSTFPDINGGIGILFEQASSRGHAQESDNGILTFPFTIRNQFTAALSTLEAAVGMRAEILDYQRQFFNDARNEASTGAIVFGDEKDAGKVNALAEILQRHKVKFHEVKNNFTKDGKTYKKGFSYIIPKNQRQSRLVNAMFEKRTTFQDSLFYDISAWTFPLAFNLDYSEDVALSQAGSQVTDLKLKTPNAPNNSNYGYLMEWHEYYSPKALNIILQEGLRAKVGMSPFSLENKEYDYGTVLIPVQNQKLQGSELNQFLADVSKQTGVTITGVQTGLTKGIDLGSGQFRAIEEPKVAILVGEGVNPYDAGEIWHLFDTRYDMMITKLDTKNFGRMDLNRYTDIILPATWGSALDKDDTETLKDWVKAGGTLIGYRNAGRFLEKNEFLKLSFKKKQDTAKAISFEQRRDYFGAQVIGGAIFEAKLDRSHPIAFGYSNTTLPMFRNTTLFVEADDNSYNNPIQYTESPLLAGYISKPNLEELKNTVPFKTERLGRGRVVYFTDNTNFRAFWYGTNKLLMNAIFFGDEM